MPDPRHANGAPESPALRNSILFVDDEPHVLEALRNLFHRRRRKWNMVFAPSAEQALESLDQCEFDLIVSDMRMPGMDGAALLERVKQQHPAVARIVLSGHADREAVIRGVLVAHQFLAKPCDVELLHGVVERTLSLQTLVPSRRMRAALGRIDRLPRRRESEGSLEAAISRGSAIPELDAMFSAEPALTAKLLHLVNSAFFGAEQSIVSLREALGYFGGQLHQLAIDGRVFAPPPTLVDAVAVDATIERADLLARIARRATCVGVDADMSATIALLQEAGSLALEKIHPGHIASVAGMAAEENRSIQEIERTLLGVTHAEIGAYLLGLWGLPSCIVDGVAFHHQPALVPARYRASTVLVQATRSIADFMMGGPRAEPLEIDLLSAFGMVEHLPTWRTIVNDELRRTAIAA